MLIYDLTKEDLIDAGFICSVKDTIFNLKLRSNIEIKVTMLGGQLIEFAAYTLLSTESTTGTLKIIPYRGFTLPDFEQMLLKIAQIQ